MTNARQATGSPHIGSVRSVTINGCAVVALLTSILGFLYVSVPLGIVALCQVTARRQHGRELAIAALVISAWWLSSMWAIAVAIVLVWLTRPGAR
ncbi:hypothetical protein LAUMK41_00505 [Mycobacterium attenuatum]|nr:hypothetical protein LAUMK41_00505 [Mycobacterium attenuatum]